MLLNIVLILAYVAFNSLGAILVKRQLNIMGPADLQSFKSIVLYFFHLFSSPLVMLGLVSTFGSAIVWMIALSRLNISVAYPIAVGLNFFVVISFGILFFRETLHLKQFLGIALIFLSIFLISSPR